MFFTFKEQKNNWIQYNKMQNLHYILFILQIFFIQSNVQKRQMAQFKQLQNNYKNIERLLLFLFKFLKLYSSVTVFNHEYKLAYCCG